MTKHLFLGLAAITVAAGIYFYTTSLTYQLKEAGCKQDCRTAIAVISGHKTWTVGEQKQPLMSVFKLFIAYQVLGKLEREKIALDTPLTITKEMIYTPTYSPMAEKYTTYPYQLSIAELLEYMISQSDNNASDILLEYAGGMQALNTSLQKLGLADIELSANEKEMSTNGETQYLNRATAADVARFVKLMREGNVLSPAHKEFFENILIKTQTGNDKLKAGLPANVTLGHKTGSSSRTKDGIKIGDNDAGFVTLGNGKTYYITVLVANSKLSDRENAALIAKISALVYRHFK